MANGTTASRRGKSCNTYFETGPNPSRICAVTFTNKAAKEIFLRLKSSHGTLVEELSLGTIHAICMKILRPYANEVGLVTGFGVADDQTQSLILRRLGVAKKYWKSTLSRFSKCRMGQISLNGNDDNVFRRYAKELRESRLIDFDEILIFTHKLLVENRTIVDDIRAKWDHILVDECQDLDATQYQILSSLAFRHRSLYFVGDDEQSIFSWRGADPGILHKFIKDFAITTPILLDRNCRSTKAIFETARRILPQDSIFTCRDIVAERESPFQVQAVGHVNFAAECMWIINDLIEDRRHHRYNLDEYAILYRTHDLGQQLETALLTAGIPCRLNRGRSINDNPVVAQVVASMRLIIAPRSMIVFEVLANLVLTEQVVQLVAAGTGLDIEISFRNYVKNHSRIHSGDIRAFLCRADNIRSLGKTSLDLNELMDAILALGIGPRLSPFDDLLGKLDDPARNHEAQELYLKLKDAAEKNKSIFVKCNNSLEIMIHRILSSAIPHLTLLGSDSSEKPMSTDLTIEFLIDSATPEEPQAYPTEAQVKIINLFVALQLYSSRDRKAVFDEYVAFDTETTELDPNLCEVIELAAVRVRGGTVIDKYHTLINVSRKITPKATETHGYVDADLEGKPCLADVWPAFRKFVGNTLMIAHNGYEYDVPILKRLTSTWKGFIGLSYYDSRPFARHVIREGSYKLVDLAQRYRVPTGRSHRALDDCLCLASVFECLQQEHMSNARKSALPHLLDALSTAIALAGPVPIDGIASELFHKGAIRALGAYSTVLEHYEKSYFHSVRPGLTLAELIVRLGGVELMNKLRKAGTNEERFQTEIDWLRSLAKNVLSKTLEERIQSILERLALSHSDELESDTDRVSLLTFHATKGLEFSRVYVTGVEDSTLPGCKTLDLNKQTEIDEARRLLYVAMTRAKDRLCLTYSAAQSNRPAGGTRFLADMGLVKLT